MRKILIVEDDHDIAQLERDFLLASDFDAELCADGRDAGRLLKQNEYEAIVLDLMLPGKDGIQLCREIREKSNVPVIMVTARKEEIDKIRGLSVGADDYMVKPFSPAELVARVMAHINIYERMKDELQPEQTEEFMLGGLKVGMKAHRVERNGVEIPLTNREFEILSFFIENPNIVFSKERLFDRIWGMEAEGDLSTVTVQVNRLRDKIEEDPGNPKMIQTVWGVGYRFCFV